MKAFYFFVELTIRNYQTLKEEVITFDRFYKKGYDAEKPVKEGVIMNIKKTAFDPQFLDQTLTKVEELKKASSKELPKHVSEISKDLENLLSHLKEYNQEPSRLPPGRASMNPDYVNKAKQKLNAVMTSFPHMIPDLDLATKQKVSDLIARLIPALSKELDILNKKLLKDYNKVQAVSEGPSSS
jgi:hypothetical protein